MLLLQKTNAPTYKTEIGATDEVLTEIDRDLAILQYVDQYAALFDTAKIVFNGIKYEVFRGDEDEPVTAAPNLPEFAPPFPLVAGCYQRALKRNKRFKAAAGYNKEIGIALGIEEASRQEISAGSVVPTLDVHAASMNYEAAAIVGNRGKSDFTKLFMRRVSTAKWQEIASGTGKAINFKIPPTTDGQPEKVEIMARLYKNNEEYGQPSNSVYVTVTP